MKRIAVSVVLFASFAIAAGCGSSGKGSDSSGDSPATQPAASRADSPASPTASPPASPAKAAKADEPATRQVFGLPAGWELAPRANYTARQSPGQVTIRANGENPTGGYEVKLFESPLRIWPPQWMLAHKKPDGPATQAITPFEATASFKSDRKVATVVVNDAGGRRLVNVAQAQN
jgi:hypothetical protein